MVDFDLICGDAISELKKLEDNCVDCIVTSPPYWKGFEYEAYFNSYLQYTEWTTEWMRECKRVLREDGTFCLNDYLQNTRFKTYSSTLPKSANDLNKIIKEYNMEVYYFPKTT